MSASYQLYCIPTNACHCDGTGYVLMDDRGATNTFAEPCPMCPLGSRHSGEYVTWNTQHPPRIDPKDDRKLSQDVADYRRLKPQPEWRNRNGEAIKSADYYQNVDVGLLSWGGGLTAYHRFQCADIGCRNKGFATARYGLCDACDPTVNAANIPSFRTILKAITLRKRGDLRSIVDIALAEQAELAAADHADQLAHDDLTKDAA